MFVQSAPRKIEIRQVFHPKCGIIDSGYNNRHFRLWLSDKGNMETCPALRLYVSYCLTKDLSFTAESCDPLIRALDSTSLLMYLGIEIGTT